MKQVNQMSHSTFGVSHLANFYLATNRAYRSIGLSMQPIEVPIPVLFSCPKVKGVAATIAWGGKNYSQQRRQDILSLFKAIAE
jgi:hypothetical protein